MIRVIFCNKNTFLLFFCFVYLYKLVCTSFVVFCQCGSFCKKKREVSIYKEVLSDAQLFSLINKYVPVGDAGVDFLVLDSAFKKTLAGLAREQAVVVAGHFVPTDGTQLFDPLLCIRLVLTNSRRVLQPTGGGSR